MKYRLLQDTPNSHRGTFFLKEGNYYYKKTEGTLDDLEKAVFYHKSDVEDNPEFFEKISGFKKEFKVFNDPEKEAILIDSKKVYLSETFKTVEEGLAMKEQRERIQPLLDHIKEIDEPEEGAAFCEFTDGWILVPDKYDGIKHKGLYHTGFIMNINTDIRDKDKRSELLKKVYG